MLLNSVDFAGSRSLNIYPIPLKVMFHAHFSNVRNFLQIGPYFRRHNLVRNLITGFEIVAGEW